MVEHRVDGDEDRALLQALQSAEDPDGAFRELFRRYYSRVKGFFRSRGFDPETCHDLSQETFLRVYRRRESFRGETSLASWIFTIAANLWRNELRRRQAEKRSGEEVSLDDPDTGEFAMPHSAGQQVPAADPGPLRVALGREQVAALGEALEQLPPQMRRVMQMHYHHEHSVKEIAVVLKISESTVKVHLHQGRKQLRQALADRFGELPF